MNYGHLFLDQLRVESTEHGDYAREAEVDIVERELAKCGEFVAE